MTPTERLTRCFLDARADLLRFLTRRVRHPEAEDILQNTWLNLREQASDPELWREPRAVLFTTAANLASDDYRREVSAQRLFSPEAVPTDTPCPRPDPEARANTLEHLERLAAALERLPSTCRDAFLLNRLEKLTHAQIAARLGVSAKTVQRYIERALAHCFQASEP